MRIDNGDLGTALSSNYPCILLTFLQSKGSSGVIKVADQVYPGIKEDWLSVDRSSMLVENGFFVSTKTMRPAPIILVPNRPTHMVQSTMSVDLVAAKVARVLNKLGHQTVALSLDQFEGEKLPRPSGLLFVDYLERGGLTVNIYQRAYD